MNMFWIGAGVGIVLSVIVVAVIVFFMLRDLSRRW